MAPKAQPVPSELLDRYDRLIAAQLGRFAAGTELENIIT